MGQERGRERERRGEKVVSIQAKKKHGERGKTSSWSSTDP